MSQIELLPHQLWVCKEAKKKRLPASEMPRIREVYVDKMNTGTDNFSKDMRSMYVEDADETLDDYMNALDEAMADARFWLTLQEAAADPLRCVSSASGDGRP